MPNDRLRYSSVATREQALLLLSHFAQLLETDEMFRSVLLNTDRDLRRGVYEALLPFLTFGPLPLEAYTSEEDGYMPAQLVVVEGHRVAPEEACLQTQ